MKKKKAKDENVKVETETEKGKTDFDSLPLSEGKDESITSGTFKAKSHEVREVIKKETGVLAGHKLFIQGTVKETGEEIEVSQARVIGKDKTPREAGMWVKEIAGKLRIGTTVSMLRHYRIPSIGAVDGKEFRVEKNPQGYWIISAC